MICPNCQTENRDQAKFCDECGFPLSGLIAQVAADIASTDDVQKADAEVPEESVEGSAGGIELQEAETPDDDLEQDRLSLEAGEAEEAQEETEEQTLEQDEQTVEPTETLPPVKSGHELLEEIVRDLESREEASAETSASDPMITAVLPATKSDDLSGLDETVYDELGERLVEGGYEVPASAWHDGATMQLPRVNGEEAAKSKSYRASDPVDKKRSKTWRIVLAIVLICAVGIAAATYKMELWGGKSVPDVVGLTQADASSILTDNGFSVRATKVKSDDTEGLVLVMDPTAGSRTDAGGEIVIHVAVGRYIPKIVGKTEAEAKEALTAEGFENVTYVKERSNQPEGTVLSVTPAPGESAKSGSVITVKVSDPYRVPDISGMYLDDAIAAIEEAGLSPYVKYYYTEDHPEGFNFGSEPAAGTILEEGAPVAILITKSRANELIAATQAYLAPGNTVNLGNYYWVISSLDSCSYLGNDQVSFAIVGMPTVSTEFGTAYFESQPYTGVITWSDDNTVVSID